VSNSTTNITLQTQDDPTVNIKVIDGGLVSGTADVNPVINFVTTGDQGPSGEQGPEGSISGDETVTRSMIAEDAIDASKIQNGSLTGSLFDSNSISGSLLQEGTINPSKLQDNSIGSDKIQNNSINADLIENGSITRSLLSSDLITANEVQDNSLQGAQLENNTITRIKLTDNSVDGDVIENDVTLQGTVTVNHLELSGSSPSLIEGPSDDSVHIKSHDELIIQNTTEDNNLRITQAGNLYVRGLYNDVDIISKINNNSSKLSYPLQDQSKVEHISVSNNVDLDAIKTKIDGVETNADVTDATNVQASGALMDFEVTNLDQVKSFSSSDYATAAQGLLADSAQQPPSEGAFVDGDKAKLDGIESNATADQTVEEIQDIAGPLVATGGTKTGIAITYDDDNGNIDFVVDHDAATNFVAEEHYRWDNDIQSTATINHLNLSSDTPGETEVLVMNDGDAVWGHGEKIHIQVRNDEGSTISAGAPLYSKGEIGGSNRILVGVCDANDSAKMPCIGIAHSEMNTTSTKDNFAVVSGIYNTNISGFTSLSVGDNLYIQDDGSLSQTKPTGESSLIQNVGIVLKTNGSTCQGMLVSAIGRTNDVPNLDSGNIFLGNSSNSPQEISVAAAVEGAGNITIDGDLKLNDDIIKGSSGNVILSSASDVVKTPLGLFTNSISGHDNTDFELKAGGNVQFTLDVDNNETAQSFSFRDGGAFGSFTEIANIDQSGNLTLSGTVDGRDVSADGSKLDNIASGAEVNVNADWSSSSGDSEILNKPTIPADLTTDGAGNIHANNVPTLNQDTTGNASTATALTSGNKTLDGNFTIGSNGAGHDFKLYGDTSLATVLWDSTYDFLKFSDLTKIVFGSGVAAADFDSSIQADGSNLVIYNDTGNIQIGDTVEITGDLTTTGGIELGHASDTTIERSTAGEVTIEGKKIVTENQSRQIINCGWNGNSTALAWLPFGYGGTGEAFMYSSNAGYLESGGFVAPCDGYVDFVVVRAETAAGFTEVGVHVALEGTEVPSSSGDYAFTSSLVNMSSDDTGYKFSGFTNDNNVTNSFSAGDVIMISFDPSTASGDSVATAVLVLDWTNTL